MFWLSLPEKVIRLYFKMKKIEAEFRDAKAKLIAKSFVNGSTITTRSGSISFKESTKVNVDMDKVLMLVSAEQLIKLATINTTTLAKILGDDFASVVSSSTSSKNIIIRGK